MAANQVMWMLLTLLALGIQNVAAYSDPMNHDDYDEVFRHQRDYYWSSWYDTPRILCVIDNGTKQYAPEGTRYHMRYVSRSEKRLCYVDFNRDRQYDSDFRPYVSCMRNHGGTRRCDYWP